MYIAEKFIMNRQGKRSSEPTEDKVVILDAGHGGIIDGVYQTAGKRSPIWDDGTQYFEGVGNRDIVGRAAIMLRKKGWKVLYTVDPSNQEDVPLNERIKNSNEHFKQHPNAFQISVHSNAFKKNVGKGAEVWTSVGETLSDPMATIYMEEFSKEFTGIKLRSDFQDGDIDKEKNLAMNRVNCPSFLIEPLFHSDREECRILQSRNGKHQLALVIANACERIYNEILK